MSLLKKTKKSKKTKIVKLGKARPFFNPLDSKTILLGTAYEQRVDVVIHSDKCKDWAELLMELKQRRAGTWEKK